MWSPIRLVISRNIGIGGCQLLEWRGLERHALSSLLRSLVVDVMPSRHACLLVLHGKKYTTQFVQELRYSILITLCMHTSTFNSISRDKPTHCQGITNRREKDRTKATVLPEATSGCMYTWVYAHSPLLKVNYCGSFLVVCGFPMDLQMLSFLQLPMLLQGSLADCLF